MKINTSEEKNSKKPLTVALIPAYNEEKNIAKVILKAKKHVDLVVVCDDGSTDMTAEIAEALGAIVVRHEENMGYGAALATLFEKARELKADIAVTLDADGQHDPNDLPKLIEPLLRGEADIVIGSRFLGEGIEEVPMYRRIGIEIITKLSKRMAYKDLTDAQSGYRAYSRKALQVVRPSELGMGASVEILMQAWENGLRVTEVPIVVKYGGKTSTHNPFVHGINVILSMLRYVSTKRPLLFYGVPGAILLSFALIFWAWTLLVFQVTRQIATNLALMAIGASIAGLVLLTTSIILWTLVSLLKSAR